VQVEILFYLDFNKESIYIEKMHCRRHCHPGFRLLLFFGKRHALNSNDLNGLYRIFLNYMDLQKIWTIELLASLMGSMPSFEWLLATFRRF
jgi:hypothetical protein